MLPKFAAVAMSVILLSPGWLSGTGLTLPVAFVPLLWISAGQPATRRGWRGMLGWAALAFMLWNAATVWWIGFATPVGPVAATLASTTLNLLAFMAYHTVSKKAPRPLAYTTFVAAWIATEYWYTTGDFSWPWLILGNGFSHDVWAVQWYEYTGGFGGELWVLVCNLLFFEAWRARRDVRRWAAAGAALLLPMGLSAVVGASAGRCDEGEVTVSIVQPDVDCYDKFSDDNAWQERNIVDLLTRVPADAQFVLLPETALPGFYREPGLTGAFLDELRDTLRRRCPGALLVAGANTVRIYPEGIRTETARPLRSGGSVWYDIYNSALGIDTTARVQLHHKGRLVIGVENTPTWVFRALKFLVVDLGGVLGQIGRGDRIAVFDHAGVVLGPSICYEGLYGDFTGGFVRQGAQLLAIASNDGWWRDTPGYRHLFTISRLRAIEHRRAVARSANTGRSGFISPCGEVGTTLGWEERGVITARLPLCDRVTFYTRHGDFVGRIAQYVLLLSALYFVAYRVKRRNYLVP
ncbi:MAG: apolipoprotein N-acyltransferase [Alistipes sp.]|nr:apolipoprotein N-acyltransferase [Alistipes sp.]